MIECRYIVLVINAVWQRIGCTSVKKALIAMNSMPDGRGTPAARALSLEYRDQDEDEVARLALQRRFGDIKPPTAINIVEWDEWLALPIRQFDHVIHTAKLSIRVPTVIIATNFSKMPLKTISPTNARIFQRDKYICQYSGRKLSRRSANIDHVNPRSRGGRDSWENKVCCDKEINLKKGNKTLEEAGLRLLRRPFAPKAIPLSQLYTDVKHFTWLPFMD